VKPDRRAQERADAAKRAAEQLQADIARCRAARAFYADLERHEANFAPLSATETRWRGLRG
jgi:hypothetical protein